MNTNILQLPVEKTLNEKDVIANKNILNKSKDLTFIRFVLFFSVFFSKESTLSSLSVYLCTLIFRVIYTISEEKSVQFLGKDCLKK